jgi:hypothetical protein
MVVSQTKGDHMKLVKIPKRFYQDHIERDLPAPQVVKSTSLHYWINIEDPALSEFLSDAEFYKDEMTSGYADRTTFGLQRSAQATYDAIKEAI